MSSQSDQPLPHVGITTLVDLPEQQLYAIDAKVDTGADSSTIWASQIEKIDDKLSFKLLDASSLKYNGKSIVVDDYQVVRVKNSFGQSEYRYKVKLTVVIAGRKIRAGFTLSDRSNNRYSILIGRKTLRGKFLVDVSKKETANESKCILMLSTKKTPVTAKYAENLSRAGKFNVTYASYDDLDYFIDSAKSLICLRDGGEDIANFDLVYFKTTAKYSDVAAATARYLENRGIEFIDEAVKYFPATSKLYQYMLLEGGSLLVPKSVFMLPTPLIKSYSSIRHSLGVPFVLKDIHGKKGEYNYLINNQTEFTKACKQSFEAGVQLIAQSFIANNCDYRVLVFEGKIGLVIKRQRLSEDTHLNNTSQGGRAQRVKPNELPPELQKACLQSAKQVARQVVGVDILQDKSTSKWYCLEVNDGPQLASGSFVEEKYEVFAKYLQGKLA